MKKWWIAAPCLLVWISLAHALTEDDCKRTSLPADVTLSVYLRDYASDCLSDAKVKGLRELGVSKETATRDISVFVRAWYQIADVFDTLQKHSASAGAGQRTNMPGVYQELSDRARLAGRDLDSGLSRGQLADVGVYGAVAWQQPARAILLPEVRNADRTAVMAPLIEIGGPLDADCAQPSSELCSLTLMDGKQLMLQLALARDLGDDIGKPTKDALAAQVAAKNALWDDYLYTSKPMLPFDFVLTDLLDGRWSKSDQYPQGFREPPATQWFLLHPAVGLEYASGAMEGEQMKPVLYLEIVGANRWNARDRWLNMPFLDRLSGVSLITSYADRPGTKNPGIGVLLTFDNIYSIGIARYDSSTTGVFLSFDLANLYRDKLRPSYESFKNGVRLRAN